MCVRKRTLIIRAGRQGVASTLPTLTESEAMSECLRPGVLHKLSAADANASADADAPGRAVTNKVIDISDLHVARAAENSNNLDHESS